MDTFRRRLHSITPCLCIILSLCPSGVFADRCTTGFSVVAPEAAVPGKTIAVLVNLHQDPKEPKRPANVTLRLQTERAAGSQEATVVCHTSKMIHGHGIISLKVPLTDPGLHTLHTFVSFPELLEKGHESSNASAVSEGHEDCEYQSRSFLTVVGPVRDVIIRPDKQIYSPGESITFWVLALDHDLRLPKSVLGTISLKDPAGTKVAIWDQVSLDEGIKKFTISLSARATLGTWMVHVSCGGSSWTGAVNVSGQGGTIGFRDSEAVAGFGGSRSPAAEEHYVELRFAPTTKRWYKPGLSFKGKVQAVSTEKYIQVKVEIFDDTTSIYSQGVEIPQGDGSFTVPYMVSNNDVLNLQAELVSVEGKEIESHYILARETLQKWNSSSKCYLVIEGLDGPMQAGSRAQVKVVSTCSCERELHVAVVTDGRLTLWAERSTTSHGSIHSSGHASDGTISWGNVMPEPGIVGTMHCSVHFSFLIKPDMAPASQILVYYISSDGEPVSDVADFEVQLLHKEVSVSLNDQKSWQVGDKIDIGVNAESGSLVCLIGGSATSDKFDPFASHSHTRSNIQGEQDFLEAGLSLFQRRCPTEKGFGYFGNGSWTDMGRGAQSSVTYRPGGPRSRSRPPLLPQPTDRIWLWDCFTYSSEVSKRRVTLPNEEGVHSVWAATVGPGGLKVAAAHSIPLATPALRVSLQQPPPLTVRETLELDVSISNNLDACMDVTALLSLTGGGRFLSNNMMYVTEKLRLGPRGATSLVVKVVVTNSGVHNLTAEVSGVAGGCVTRGGDVGPQGGSIKRIVTLRVRSEGLTRTDTESAYFCANEHTLISTNDKYEYEWISAPRNREVLVFEVKAGNSVRVALSDERGPTDSMYHVNIGDGGNSLVWIGRGQHGYGVHLSAGEISDALSAGGYRTFWVSWARGTLTAGKGALPPTGTLAIWRLDTAHRVRHVGFSSPWGHQADFRVWNFNDEAGFSQVVQLSLPRWAVPGTASGELLVAGGLAIPTSPIDFKYGMINDDDTKMSPTSSLAAATAIFAPLFTLSRANSTQHETIIDKLPGQVQRLLSFRRNDNSFSDHPSMSSHLATVHALEVLTKIQSYFGVDPELLESMKHWIQMRQEEDGSFTPLSADIKISMLTTDADIESNTIKKSSSNPYEELDYGIVEKWKNLSKEVLELERKVEVTAETLATLMEIGMENDIDLDTVVKARKYLEKYMYNVTSSHPLAAMTLALALSQSPLLPEALQILKNASTTEEGDFGWPHPLPRRDADWLYEEDSTRRLNPPVLTSLEDFKASLCVLSIYTALGDLQSAEPVARYLFYRSHLLDKHAELLYQAVKSFAAFSVLAYDRHRSLTVSLATAGMELTDTVELKADHPARHLHLPSLPTKVFVYATGAGCATVQGRITYSAYTPSSDNALLTLWSAVIEEIRPERSSLEELQGKLPALNIKTCFKWKSQDRSGALRLEVSLFSGYEVVSVSAVVLDEGTFADLQHGSKDNFVWFAFSNISSACPVCVTYQARSTFILSSLRPAFATIYPATRPDLAAELFFHTKPGSPLLKGIMEDDLITWFGKTDNGIPNVGQDLPDICECGKICRNNLSHSISTEKPPSLQVEKTTINLTSVEKIKNETYVNDKEYKANYTSSIIINDSKNVSNDIPIIIPSVVVVKHIKDFVKTTISPLKLGVSGDEIVVQQKIKPSIASSNAKMLYDIAKKQPYQKKQPVTRKKGTLKYTYGENHEMLKKNVKSVHNSNLNSSMNQLKNEHESENITVTSNKNYLSITTQIPNSTIQSNTPTSMLSTVSERPTTVVAVSTESNKSFGATKNTPKDNDNHLNISKTTENSLYTTTDTLNTVRDITPLKEAKTTQKPILSTPKSVITTRKLQIDKNIEKTDIPILPTSNTIHQISQIPKSVNHEKQHPPSKPISETALELISEIPPSKFLPGKKSQFLVVNRNELWSLLKEVVQIEMDKNQEKQEVESNKINNLDLIHNRQI